MKKKHSVVVLWQDADDRQVSKQYCDELIRRFWDRFDIRVEWFEVETLSNPVIRTEATRLACEAELIIYALKEAPMPQRLSGWTEETLSRRCDKEGALVLLAPSRHTRNELILRNVAHRAGLDFITELPQSLNGNLPDSPELYRDRAHQMSGLLTEILQRPPVVPPPTVR
jgi:hypothetical protein